ncbi:MAG TPA: M15 family metallopeptidase [Candidatus Saccharimonadales bacterium]|nr:M15 family metallopeptidase [Candidatus Saccharimonadales bacterium]
MIETAESDLVVVGEYRQSGREVKLRAGAAVALRNLITEARAAGVTIIPISGFRSVAYQQSLFQKAVAKYGSEYAAVRWVARPGHSEHHTGLVIDLGDEANPAGDVEPTFEETPAFYWLQKNAAQFGFELSFPRNNPRGVNYEPWHWRFVGTPEAKQVFQP